jgi:hypothetical protein
VTSWEQIVQQIAVREDFKDERFLYMVESVFNEDLRVRTKARRNLFRLGPNREYEVRLYHFHPDEANQSEATLGLATSHPSISFTTNPEMILDSRYDLKRVRFHTGAPNTRERGIISARRQRQTPDWDWEMDLPFQIRGVFWRKVGTGALIGLFLAVPMVVATIRDGDLSTTDKQVVCLVALISGLLAGIAASFGLRRSL